MGFRRSLMYIPALIAGIYLGACGTPKDTSEVREAVQQEATQDSILISQPYKVKIDSTLSRADSNYKSVISGLRGINESLDSVNSDLVRIHEDMVILKIREVAKEIHEDFLRLETKVDCLGAKMDSVISSP